MTTNLTHHGIGTETAGYRIHVCFETKRMYVFPVAAMLSHLSTHFYPMGYARQVGRITAEGVLVPVDQIPGLRTHELIDAILSIVDVKAESDESTKGRAAVAIAWNFYPPDPGRSSLADDIAGTDYLHKGCSIQVKCDWFGGPRELGGTGNLFIQTAEANPHGKH